MQTDKPLVVFDGSCGICVKNLTWVRRLDWLKVFRDSPYQNDALYTAYPALDKKACEQALHVLFATDRVYAGADAIREILLRLPLTVPLGLLMAIPPIRQISRTLYPIIARNRYCLGGNCSPKKGSL